MDWDAFHFWMSFGCMCYALSDARPHVGRQHALGAEVIFGVWVASWAARNILSDVTPLAAYASIDLFAAIVFATLTARRKAIWSALLVILHGAMLLLHLAYFVSGRVNEGLYAWFINTLFFLSVLTVFTATAAGRHAWGERLDSFLMARLRGWTWTGFIRFRKPSDFKAVA